MTNLINLLLEKRAITKEQLQDAKDKQIGAKKSLQELLVEMGFISETALIAYASEAFEVPVFDTGEEREAAVAKLVPFEAAVRYNVFPIRKKNNWLVLAMSDPGDLVAIDTVSNLSGLPVEPVLASKSAISKMIEEYYKFGEMLYDLLKNTSAEAKVSLVKDDSLDVKTIDFVAAKGDDSFLIKLVNTLLADAVKLRASDVHIEPQEKWLTIRYRVDGYLKNILNVPVDLQPRFVARIKILAELDVAETRKTQDGRIKIFVNDRQIDLRISVIPTFYGEKIAIRLLDHQEAKVVLEKIGFEEDELRKFKRALKKPQGMVLVTGPTGSGKTSTLYAGLNFIKNETRHIITIEDPVEYLIEGINQVQLNPVKEVTFATSLRSILRQDPNIIFVGEIRDKETAEIAFQAAQTGHLVLSTLHTMSSVASISRLLDIGLEPYFLSSSLVMVVAQRLVRLICPYCKEEYTPDIQELERFSALTERIQLKRFYRGKGCEKCNFSAFFGRTAIFEILEVTDTIRTLIDEKASEIKILKEAEEKGLQTLLDSAIKKVMLGLTTLDEIARVVDITKEEKIEEHVEKTQALAKILIVDDEEDLLNTLEMRLKTFQYEIVKARDGLEALKTAHQQHLDLIIMDVNMPNMDGFEAIKALRSQLATAKIPIILLTARQDKDSELSGLDAGADDYIVKPYDKDKLLARIKMLLRKK